MKNLFLATAVVAALGFSTAAFAGEGNGEPFPNTVNLPAVSVQAEAADTGSSAYPAANPALSVQASTAELLPANGSNGIVQTANSMPAGAMDGTVQFAQAQAVNRYFAAHDAHRFAVAHGASQPKG